MIPRSSYFNFSVTIEQTSTRQYDHELVAEFFAIGDEVDGNKYILLDYQRSNFMLTDENKRRVELAGETVEILDYILNGYRRGTKFGGYLVLITDSRGEIIAYKTTKGAYYENLNNLRTVPVGRYFDKTCTRCTPTRPKKWDSVYR